MEDRVDDGSANGGGAGEAEAGPFRASENVPANPRDEPGAAGGTEALTDDAKVGGADLDSDSWGTTPALFEALNRSYGPFDFDLFASPSNKKCDRFFTKEQDALKQPWHEQGRNLFGNPPYSRGNQLAAGRMARETVELYLVRCTLILQSCTETELFHEVLMAGADLLSKETISTGPLTGTLLCLEATRCMIRLHLLRGRVSFLNPVTGEIAGAGRTGTLCVSFLPRRHRW